GERRPSRIMLTPRLRRRLSELARTPAPPTSWTGVRGGVSAPAETPPPPPAPQVPGLSRKLPGEGESDPTTLLLMPFDPVALGVETETDLGRCCRIRLAVGDHLDDAAERAQRVLGAAERMK